MRTSRLIASLAATGTLALASPGFAEPAPPNAPMKTVLDKLAALGGKPLPTLTAEEAREQPSPADAAKQVLKDQGKPTAPEELGKVADIQIDGAAGKIPARVYTPKGTGPFPLLVYFHGGGWVIATNDTYDASARALTNLASCVVLSVEYRKGPEAKFPAAHDDAFAAWRWAIGHAKTIGADSARIAVAGESAGGNLAANVAIMARDQKIQQPLYQLLVYPIAGYDLNTPSYQANATAKPLSKDAMAWFFKNYLASPEQGADPRISLDKVQNLKGLPPATVITAQIDPLQSEGQAYAKRLQAAGVQVNAKNYDGVTHEFFGMAAVVPEAKQAEQVAANDLKKAFAKTQMRQGRMGDERIPSGRR